MRRTLPVLCFAFVLTTSFHAHADESLTVYGNQPQGPFLNRNGFLHGRFGSHQLDRDKVTALKPRNWRLARGEPYQEATRYTADITYLLSDAYATFKGGYAHAKPWLNWAEYEQFILSELIAIHLEYPDHLPAYYDIWNEPDHPYFWRGNESQLLETFARCAQVVRSFDPSARLVGPSLALFIPGDPGLPGMIEFLIDLDRLYGVRLDAISWHENGGVFSGGPRPEHIPGKTQYVRDQIDLLFSDDYEPEMHINEFTGTQNHLSPGWNVGYLYYLDFAGIDAAMRSCWDMYSEDPPDSWNGCVAGLDGMFMKDGERTQPAYWANWAYAQMEGHEKLRTLTTDATAPILASHDLETKSLHILVARYWESSPEDVRITVRDYPYSVPSAVVDITRLPHDPGFYTYPPKAIPLDAPIPFRREEVPLDGRNLVIQIDDVQDGEAYILTVTIPDAVPYGLATGGTAGIVPQLDSEGLPCIGSSDYLLEGSALYGGQPCFLLTGFSRVTVDLGEQTYLNVLPPWVVFSFVADGLPLPGYGRKSIPAPIPADPTLDGIHIMNQILVTDPGAPKGLSTTLGLDTTIFQ